MKKTIVLTVNTELEDQEIVDMLVDGFIDRAGSISVASVNGKKFEINDSVFTIGHGTRKLDLGARSSSKTKRQPVSREHSECNAVGESGSGEAV